MKYTENLCLKVTIYLHGIHVIPSNLSYKEDEEKKRKKKKQSNLSYSILHMIIIANQHAYLYHEL